jgi:aminopeptidase N
LNRFALRVVAATLCFASNNLFAQIPGSVAEHAIEVTLTPANGEILISDEVLVADRDYYRFRLVDWLNIESLLLDGEAVEPVRQGQGFRVTLADREQHQIIFRLRGLVPPRNASPASHSSSGSDGVYLPGYDAWIPRDERGLMDYRMMVTVPPGQRAVATGKLVEERTADEAYQATFEAAYPGEPPSLFAGPYQVRERHSRGLRLRTYFHVELARFADAYLDAADTYLQRYQARIGAYPYADFHVISAPLPVGLGFPNLTYVGRRVIPLPFMRTRSLAHEVLHNWWGNGISVDYTGGNWAEGLTTYMADYALAAERGGTAAQTMREQWLRDYAALPAARDQPVSAFKSKQHQASRVIGYNKVAFIFHMLAKEIGVPAFDDGLRRFWDRHKHGTAGWRDLKEAFEQPAGRDLDWFFAQWVQRSGAPRLSLGAISVQQLEAGYRTRVEILQPVTGYRFRLPVLLATDAGIKQHEISISDSLTRIEFVTPAKPLYLQIDPESDIFRRLHQNEAPPILRDVTLDPAAGTLIASTDADFVAVARNLASRLMDTQPHFDNLAATRQPGRSLLLITTNDRLHEQLNQLQLELPSGLPDVAYSAGVWTTRRASGAAVLVVSAANADDLKSLLRPLPHYGGQSYVLFEAGHAFERGVWPITRGALFRQLDGNT